MRRRSREIALHLIYELDLRPETELSEAIALYPFENEPDEAPLPGVEQAKEEPLYTDPDRDLDESESEEVRQYACELVMGVKDSFDELEELLRTNMIGWRPERMVAVDRAAIALALYEGLISQKVPLAVAISEAVELSKAYGTEESGRFVNGVLGKIVRGEQAK